VTGFEPVGREFESLQARHYLLCGISLSCGLDPSPFGWVAFSGRRESILGGFGLDILSRTPAERHPAKRRLA
ncbi:MAG: hypothetical protein OXF43_07720, partial [Gammaproteobacteria bacterium]|nr:hypothetical protein [Gammaproteobacteria bacterium]